MKIHEFSYRDNATSWELEPVVFEDLNLLVGVSGVGKTMTLKAITSLIDISDGESANGVEWTITFTDEVDRECVWKGKFSNFGLERELRNYFTRVIKDDDEAPELPTLLYEEIVVDGKEIARRNESDIVFKSQPTLKLSPNESIVKLLKEEADIAPIHKSFTRIVWSRDFRGGRIVEFDKLLEKYKSLEEIQDANLDTFLKLALLKEHEPRIFEEIKDIFINIFPHVEDIKIDTISQCDLPLQIAEFPFFQVKEKNVERWFYPWELANGMLKTLSVVSDLYLLPLRSVVLIDEFENSLGVNCIDAVGDFLSQNRDIQLIVTSHHPYIINTINMDYWKILTRRGGVVRVRRAEDFERLAKKSLHDNFTRLLEIDEIVQGVDGE